MDLLYSLTDVIHVKSITAILVLGNNILKHLVTYTTAKTQDI